MHTVRVRQGWLFSNIVRPILFFYSFSPYLLTEGCITLEGTLFQDELAAIETTWPVPRLVAFYFSTSSLSDSCCFNAFVFRPNGQRSCDFYFPTCTPPAKIFSPRKRASSWRTTCFAWRTASHFTAGCVHSSICFHRIFFFRPYQMKIRSIVSGQTHTEKGGNVTISL